MSEEIVIASRVIPEALASYDWREAFGYAGDTTHEDYGYAGTTNGSGWPLRVEGATCSVEPVLRRDVAEIKHISEGENDGEPWIVCGRLHDGRWFLLSAGCDYTGWDCQAGGQCWVADDYDALVRFGFGDNERTRWGL